MNTRFLSFSFLCSLVFSIGLCQADQLPSALINSIYPPSGTRGTEVELTVKGKYLEDAEALFFSDPSLKAKPKKGRAKFRARKRNKINANRNNAKKKKGDKTKQNKTTKNKNKLTN